MASVNEQLQEAAVSHAVDLQHYSNGVVRRILRLLNRVDADLMGQITAALDRLTPQSFTVDRLELMLGAVRQLNRQAYDAILRELPAGLRELTEYEARYQERLFRAVLPGEVVTAVGLHGVNVDQVHAAAMARPFQGRLLSEWAQDLGTDRMARIRDAIRMGYVENQTIDQIVRRIRGTKAAGYADGLLEISRRDAEAVVRTAVSHTAAYARDAFFQANEELIGSQEWTSTLDTRTTDICRARSGKRYTLDGKPIGHSLPWLGGPGRAHWGCRSEAVAVTKSWKELTGLDIEEFSPSTRASMDGQVAGDLTYNQWLTNQSATRQDEVLGPTRGKLFRQGKLPMDRFYNNKGRMLTLDELRERDAAAFARAGLGG